MAKGRTFGLGKNIAFLALATFASALMWGCAGRDAFLQTAVTDFFTQDYNPEHLDVLWVIDNRSTLFPIRDQLLQESRNLFTRLDASARNYQMAFTTGDAEYYPGLKPSGSPIIVTKNYGSFNSRVNLFGSAMTSVMYNLATSSQNQSFRSALNVLQSSFVPRANVPLVLVFISDADDQSPVPGGSIADAESYYAKAYLGLKNDKKDLLRIYSINYFSTGEGGTRCATKTADIDLPGFRNTYFDLAVLGEGKKADICGAFANMIDLSGIRLKTLPNRFKLSRVSDPADLDVLVTKDGSALPIDWTYDSMTNEIVFVITPPEGSTIQVTYRKQ